MIKTSAKDNCTEIPISDTGCGIPEKIKENIFEPLVSTKAKGTGPGLAIVKKIIDAHNRKIKVESAEGKGTALKAPAPMTEN